MNWLQRLKQGLSKTSSKIGKGISDIFTNRKLDDETLEELEELLITSDLGITSVNEIIADLKKRKFEKDIPLDEVKNYLVEKLVSDINPFSKHLEYTHKPHVIMFCGVNGNGKTTTIGKIASKLVKNNKKVIVAACDTFRAAADAQLQVWAERSGCDFLAGEANSDPASVAYKAYEKAMREGYDHLLIDTAGRLHNKNNLMEELAKINRVIKKLNPDAPHEIILVLDATTGQNALAQAQAFKEMINITGMIITKLDGTAKAGIVVAIIKKYKLPVYLIGVGEGIEDLDEFTPKEFIQNILS
jgi:fused signal recognition particle receptor